jgi:hypothetical protein
VLAGLSRIPGAEDVVAVCVQHALEVIADATRTGAGIGVVNGGAVQVESSLTHGLKAPGFNP